MLDILLTVAYLVGIISFLFLFALFAVWFERKLSGWLQNRLGPMETGGFHGWLQTVADAIKLLTKEDIIPGEADKPLFRLAPYIIFVGTLGAFVVIPFGVHLIGADLNVGLYYVIAISSIVAIGILMAGWASNNKWSLYGAMRSAAQIISYEIPIGLSLLVPAVMAGSLSMQTLVAAQGGGFWNWNFLQAPPFGLIAFIIYFWASVAEVNRTPFDIPEGESELVAGYATEYSGMRYAIFFMAEYANLFIVSAIGATLFLGGWSSPLPFLTFIPGPIWFLGKSMVLVFIQMWLRWTLPRLRVDQLMGVCWKVFLPFSFLNLIVVSFWMLWVK